MLGLINVENKKIFINGKDINLLKNQWQDIVSVTSQDPFILNENLEFNISLDKEEIDNDNLNSVLELINLIKIKINLSYLKIYQVEINKRYLLLDQFIRIPKYTFLMNQLPS